MQRAISRAFRGTCRKFRENDCPIAAGEDVRKKQNDDKNSEFAPRKHSWEEAVTWTTGLVLGYQLTHGRRRGLIDECPPAAVPINPVGVERSSSRSPVPPTDKACPFTISSKVFSQPVFNSRLNVQRRKSSSVSVSSATVVSSIDTTPFIHDDIQESELPEKSCFPSIVEDDDIVFAFENDYETEGTKRESSKFRKPSILDRIRVNPAEYGTKYGADLLSVLGAFEFLQAEAQLKSSNGCEKAVQAKPKAVSFKESKARPSRKKGIASDDLNTQSAPLRAIELMKKGADLGSCRAFYNMGVAYERLNDNNLAKMYYKKAADLGHPLATYNCAVLALRDGRLTDGYALMKTASDFGVPEAMEFLKPPKPATRDRDHSTGTSLEVGNV